MLLGIFLYNGTMFYELKNGTLVETKDAQGNFDLTQVLGNKYLEDVDSEKCVIVDTYSNRCFLISKDLLHHGAVSYTHLPRNTPDHFAVCFTRQNPSPVLRGRYFLFGEAVP